MDMQRVIHSFSDCLTVLSGNKSDQSSFHWSTTKADHCRWRGRIQLWWRHAKQGNRALENDQREVSHTWHKMHTGGMGFKKSYALKIWLNRKFWSVIKETLVMTFMFFVKRWNVCFNLYASVLHIYMYTFMCIRKLKIPLW